MTYYTLEHDHFTLVMVKYSNNIYIENKNMLFWKSLLNVNS